MKTQEYSQYSGPQLNMSRGVLMVQFSLLRLLLILWR